MALVATVGGLPALCPFRVCTGLACPLCGMTRALGSMATGDVAASLRHHPLLLLVAGQVAVVGVASIRAGGKPSSRIMNPLMVANAVVFTAVWLLRWRTGSLDTVAGN